MAAGQSRTVNFQKKEESSKLVVPVLLVCSAAIAICMAFGNPVLWTPMPKSGGFTHLNSPNNQTPPDGFGENGNNANEKEMETIAEYRTISQTENTERAENLLLAAEAINRKEIAPGQTFSFNSAVGDVANDNRYLEAPAVIKDEVKNSRGGGVAQVATALYVAGLKAGLEVVERHAHGVPIDYASIGLDAAISYGSMDLVLKNTSTYPIHISAEAVGQTVWVRIIGQPLGEGNTIGAASMIVDRLNDRSERIEPDAVIDPSQTIYYVVESYRIYYKDATKIEQQYLFSDTYKASPDVLLILESGGFDPLT